MLTSNHPLFLFVFKWIYSFVKRDFAGTTGSSFNNVGNPVAQLDFFDEEQKVSSYKVV
jgi:hypothetical protein